MRSLTIARNYCLLVFFLLMVGGVVLRPAALPAPPQPSSVTASR